MAFLIILYISFNGVLSEDRHIPAIVTTIMALPYSIYGVKKRYRYTDKTLIGFLHDGTNELLIKTN